MATFFEEYKALDTPAEKAAFRNKIMTWCDIQQSTFQKWMRLERVPSLPQKVIAHHMQRERTELFPNA